MLPFVLISAGGNCTRSAILVRLRSQVRHSIMYMDRVATPHRSAHMHHARDSVCDVHHARQRGVKTGVGMLLTCIMHVKGVSSGTTPLPVRVG